MLAAAAVVCRAACTECEILKRQQQQRQQEVERGRGKFQPASQPACKPKAISGGASLLLLLLQAEKAELLKGRPDARPTSRGGTRGKVRQQQRRRRQQAAKQPKLRIGGSSGRGQRVAAAQTNNASRCAVVKFSFSAAVACCPPASSSACCCCCLCRCHCRFYVRQQQVLAGGCAGGVGEEQGACSWGQLLLLLLPRLEVLLDAKKLASLAPDAANKVMS